MSIYASQKKYFEKAYRTGEHGWPVEGASAPVVRFVERFKKERPSGRILDIGCGEGRHTALFAKAGYRAVGLDYQPLALERARRFSGNGAANPNLRFMLGDVFHLPFRPGAFDVLLDYGCLHHVRRRDTQRYLANVLPVLKPGGYFLLSCFSTDFKHHADEKRKRNWMVHHGHYDRFFRKGDFRSIFGGAFNILQIEEERQPLYVFHHVLMQKKG
ncbi:MAG: methyltransferase domain-containing protein [Nitrospirae bacterium]|nr:methyltransferase domain-containing protein [Candidatus Manganitrophaceae bacterium]